MIPVMVLLINAQFMHENPSKLVADLYVLVVSLYGYSNATLTLMFVAPYRKHFTQQLRWITWKLGVMKQHE